MDNKRKDLIFRAAQVTPSPRQLDWQRMELTAFIHFTVNTFTDKEWGDGTESPSIFNPGKCDPRQWISTLKDAGFKMAILTAKHHDGFCLWPSKYTDHSIKNSPYKDGQGDIVREFTDACREFGMKAGIYLSPWDRHDARYGDSPAYNEYFLNQLRELGTEYGEISCFWFDGACAEGPNGKRQEYDWDAYYSLIRELQPKAMISDIGPDARWCGNEAGRGREAEWSVVNLNKSILAFNHENAILEDVGSLEVLGDGENLIWHPSEVDTSIRPGWFWHESENNKVKSLAEMINIYFNSVGGNAVLLLNLPPDTRGLLHENDVKRLQEFKTWLDEAFAVNFTENAAVKANAGQTGHPAENILDGSPDSFWRTDDWQDTAEIVFELKQKEKFNCAVLQEYIPQGQHIENFVLEVLQDGSWLEVISGQTVGHKKIVTFPNVEAQQIKLRITGSRLCPTLSSFGLYHISLPQSDTAEKHTGSDRSKWTVYSTSECANGFKPEFLFDGKEHTIWKSCGLPAELSIDLGEEKEIQGISILPPQETYQGHILEYEVYFNSNSNTPEPPEAAGELSNTVNNPIRQNVMFNAPVKGRYIKLKVISTAGGYDFAAATDIDIIPV
jgi:alpha-L-fucosidase